MGRANSPVAVRMVSLSNSLIRNTSRYKLIVTSLGSEVIGLHTPPEAFHSVDPPNRSLIELKFDARCPAWLIKAVEALELDRVSFSKYAESMERAFSRCHLPAV